MYIKIIFKIIALIAVLMTVLPYTTIQHWCIRMLDFPHFQLTIFTAGALLLYFLKFDFNKAGDYLIAIILTSCFFVQMVKIFPYTKFASFEIKKATTLNEDQQIKLYTANVLQSNNESAILLKEVRELEPDIVLLTETNNRWQEDIAPEMSHYPFKLEYPLDNTYGMLLYSKFELIDPEIKFIVDDSIPSIHTKVRIGTGETIQLYAIHPTPPLPPHNPMSVDRDAEMMKIALLSHKSDLPVIVMGDFNDVAWSESTKLFQKVSGLLDMRKGRGFYNTYHAKNWLLRWPLDHIFVSEDFRVVNILRGRDIESDHFPFFTTLSLEPEVSVVQRKPAPDRDLIEQAQEKIIKEREQENSKSQTASSS